MYCYPQIFPGPLWRKIILHWFRQPYDLFWPMKCEWKCHVLSLMERLRPNMYIVTISNLPLVIVWRKTALLAWTSPLWHQSFPVLSFVIVIHWHFMIACYCRITQPILFATLITRSIIINKVDNEGKFKYILENKNTIKVCITRGTLNVNQFLRGIKQLLVQKSQLCPVDFNKDILHLTSKLNPMWGNWFGGFSDWPVVMIIPVIYKTITSKGLIWIDLHALSHRWFYIRGSPL